MGPAELVLVEVVGVYCAFCVEQLPAFNRLHARLAKAGLSGRIKMLALAAGGTPQETQLLGKEYAYPVLPDESYALHRLLGDRKAWRSILEELRDSQASSLYGKMAASELASRSLEERAGMLTAKPGTPGSR